MSKIVVIFLTSKYTFRSILTKFLTIQNLVFLCSVTEKRICWGWLWIRTVTWFHVLWKCQSMRTSFEIVMSNQSVTLILKECLKQAFLNINFLSYFDYCLYLPSIFLHFSTNYISSDMNTRLRLVSFFFYASVSSVRDHLTVT